ncbi:MAG TPA: arsenic resistance N-acetyltransferase ArsN2 [Polyangiaceae bacterium]|nr:arsenic resistance N-acetyltransferase ArsN2 [Polyangiaceae bacterium]
MTAAGTLELTSATRRDLPDVLALLQRNGLLETGVEAALERFTVARADGVFVGCAGLEVYGKAGLLRSVAVESQARNSGLGTALVNAVVAEARKHGLRELYLLTTTAPAFFARLGFRSLPRRAVPPAIAGSWEFRVGCPETALIMRLPLQQPS